jgi:hypothetical protein
MISDAAKPLLPMISTPVPPSTVAALALIGN